MKENYHAVKLHFSTTSYNFTKYNGRVKKGNFQDIVPYAIIAKGKYKKDFPDFFIPGLFKNPKMRIDYFITEDYNRFWAYWKSYQTSPKYFLDRELSELKPYMDKKGISFDKLFAVESNNLPIIYNLIVKDQVSPQTILYLDQVLNFSALFENKVTEKILYPKIKNRLKKIQTFVKPQQTNDLKKIIRNVFCS